MNNLMKLLASVVLFSLPSMLSASCTTEDTGLLEANVSDAPQTSELMKDTIKIIIGHNNFTAILESNATANEFKKMLPLTISMKDLNSNEKFFDFADNLPASASNPRTINSGDLMLWGSNTLVLFYKTFNTSYSYTRLGKIENPTGLAKAVGPGNVTVTFQLLNN
ncbi:MAG TPA: cyclophilin-like fold protein [Chryseosolibacter sp.]|nr:cyclophilin-like fold protein [Chryseosolibacter sp.]